MFDLFSTADNGDGLCNSFDTTLACDDIIALEDVTDEDDADSGVHNTPDILNNNNNINSSDDIGDHSLDILTHDSLYESLKYQQGNFFYISYLTGYILPVIYLNLNCQKVPTKQNI